MGNPSEKKVYTFEEYLAIEEVAETRHEYFYGAIYAMAGTKASHNLTVLNIATLLRGHFRGKGCRIFAENVKLELISQHYYVYPDVMVTCHPNDLESNLIMKATSILIEVLSKSTAVYDLNTKLDLYLKLPSLLYYLIVSQTEYKVKIYERQDHLLSESKSAWGYHIIEGLENEVSLPQLSIRLPMREIYEDVKLTPFQELPD